LRFKSNIRDLGERILGKICSENEDIINWKDWLQKYNLFN